MYVRIGRVSRSSPSQTRKILVLYLDILRIAHFDYIRVPRVGRISFSRAERASRRYLSNVTIQRMNNRQSGDFTRRTRLSRIGMRREGGEGEGGTDRAYARATFLSRIALLPAIRRRDRREINVPNRRARSVSC